MPNKKLEKKNPNAVESYKKYKKQKRITPKKTDQRMSKNEYRSPYTGKKPYEDAIRRRNNKIAEKRVSTRYADDRTGAMTGGPGLGYEEEPKGFINKIKARLK